MKSIFLKFCTAALLGSAVATANVQAADLHVMSSGGFTAAYKLLGPKFAASTGNTLDTALGPSMGKSPEAIPNRLQRGDSFRDTAKVLKMTRYAVAWMATGCAMGAYEAALKYAQERMQFGRPIGSFQLVQDLLAKMIANITASQCLIVRQAQLHVEGKLTDAHAALAKAFCTAKCRETVAWARELLGGNGIVADYKGARFFADCEALYSYEGTYQMQNLIVGKAITGLGAFI